jgi:hypothetical protein
MTQMKKKIVALNAHKVLHCMDAEASTCNVTTPLLFKSVVKPSNVGKSECGGRRRQEREG